MCPEAEVADVVVVVVVAGCVDVLLILEPARGGSMSEFATDPTLGRGCRRCRPPFSVVALVTSLVTLLIVLALDILVVGVVAPDGTVVAVTVL